MFGYPTVLIGLLFLGASVPGVATDRPAKPKPEKIPLLSNRAMDQLFAKDWDASMRFDPQKASILGVHTYDDQLTDYSPKAISQRHAHDCEMLRQAQAIDRNRLEERNRVSYDLFVWTKRMAVKRQRFPNELIPITHLDGMVVDLSQLPDSMVFKSGIDFAKYASRLNGVPGQVDQVIDLMLRGIKLGFTPPREAVASVQTLIADLIPEDFQKSPFHAPYAAMPESIPVLERESLGADARLIYLKRVVPSLARLLAFFRDVYLPGCRTTIGCSDLPDGETYYRWAVKAHTTTSLTPKQIHEMGKAEVTRIHREMEKLMVGVGHGGDFKAFLELLRTNPAHYYTNPEDLIRGYQELATRANEKLPRLFNRLPSLNYGIKRIPASREPFEIGIYYDQDAIQDGFSGVVYANGYKPETRPKFDMEAKFLHEAVPGHHLQLQLSKEMKGLPMFRQHLVLNAHCEGWALYAERLGYEMGFYRDPYSRFGQLNSELLRAMRLVVDTGIHAFRWTEEEGVRYIVANSSESELSARTEVRRYAIWPAQALAYTVGQQQVLRLRKNAETRLGSSFDLAKFHDQILSEGALTLEMLDRLVSSWITETEHGRHSRGSR